MLTLCDPMDCSPPGSSVHGILRTGVAAVPFSRRSFWSRDWAQVPALQAVSLPSESDTRPRTCTWVPSFLDFLSIWVTKSTEESSLCYLVGSHQLQILCLASIVYIHQPQSPISSPAPSLLGSICLFSTSLSLEDVLWISSLHHKDRRHTLNVLQFLFPERTVPLWTFGLIHTYL